VGYRSATPSLVKVQKYGLRRGDTTNKRPWLFTSRIWPLFPDCAIQGTSARFPIRRVFCIGRNYRWPGDPEPFVREAPFFFMKPSDCVVAAQGVLPYPPGTEEFCHEIELVVAIGKDGIDIPEGDAFDFVWGFAAGLDMTRRDQHRAARQLGRPWEGSKAFDQSAPMTPLVPAGQVLQSMSNDHPFQAGTLPTLPTLHGSIWLDVNREPRQQANIADLLWQVPALISFLSSSVQLRAGDLIFTGTPFGVGPVGPGDVLTGGIEHIGTFSVTIGQ